MFAVTAAFLSQLNQYASLDNGPEEVTHAEKTHEPSTNPGHWCALA